MQTAVAAGLSVAVIAGLVYYVHRAASGIDSDEGVAALGFADTGKPVIWWVVDDSQVNGRQWLDFGNRTTREPNEPYLALCLDRARALVGSEFDIRVLVGRASVYRLLGCDASQSVPPALWMAWCRAALLSRFGGLWLDGSVLLLPSASGPVLKERLAGQSVLMFGTDPAENLVSSAAAAGLSAGWAAAPHHPMWSGLERDLQGLIEQGAPSWSSVEARRGLRTLWDKHCSGMTVVDRVAEVGRDEYGRRLELEALLGTTEVPVVSEQGMWLIFPDGRDGLERASRWQWFTRLSKSQILESQFAWAKLATGERG